MIPADRIAQLEEQRSAIEGDRNLAIQRIAKLTEERDAAMFRLALANQDAEIVRNTLGSVCDERDAALKRAEEAEAEAARTCLKWAKDTVRAEAAERELAARKGDPVTRLHNLCRGLGQSLACGHDLMNWCEVCETCAECRDTGGPSAKGKLDAALALNAKLLEAAKTACVSMSLRYGYDRDADKGTNDVIERFGLSLAGAYRALRAALDAAGKGVG